MTRRLVAVVLLACAAAALAQDPAPKAPPAKPVVRKLPASIDQIALSPDGGWVAAADWKDALILFSATGPEQRALPNVDAERLVFTPDSRFLAVLPRGTDEGRKLLLYETATGAAAPPIDISGERAGKSEYSVSATHVWDVLPGREGAQLRLARNSGLETWDASTGAQVGETAKFDGSSYALSADGSLAAVGHSSEIDVIDVATGAKRFQLADPEPDGKPQKGKMILTTTRGVCGFVSDGSLLLVRVEREVLKDPNALSNDNLSPEKRLAAIKTTWWIEAVRTADGKTAWKQDVDEKTYADDVAPGAALVAVVDKGALHFRDAATGASKGKWAGGKKAAAVAVSADGKTFWVGTDEGLVLPAK
jgi:hypothetical protein